MWNHPKGKGLFVFSDPGGAKPLLSLLSDNKQMDQEVLIISDRRYSFFKEFGVVVHQPSESVEDDFKSFKPDFLVTGTSYTSSIELNYIKKAKELKVPSYSFVDHWTAVRGRFLTNGEEILPEKILLIDNRAKQLAIEQGLDESMLLVIGNPYHEWLKKWKPSLSKADFLNSIKISDNRKLLLFAPDPLSNVDGKKTFGFDEHSASTLLLELFEKNKNEFEGWRILIKPHPNQKPEKLNNVFSGHESFMLLDHDVDTNSAIYFSDVVLGFFSSLLIEAAVMNKKIIRFFPEPIKDDPLAGMKIGEIAIGINLLPALKRISNES